jgi:hypothetical protein
LRHHNLPLFPEPVKTPVSNFDYVWSLHLILEESSRKYFNYRPYFIGVPSTSVENFVEKIVDILRTKCGPYVDVSVDAGGRLWKSRVHELTAVEKKIRSGKKKLKGSF